MDGGRAEDERDPKVPLMLGTNWTDGRRAPSASPSWAGPAMVGRRQGGTKVAAELVAFCGLGGVVLPPSTAAAPPVSARGEDGSFTDLERGEGEGSAMSAIVLRVVVYVQ